MDILSEIQADLIDHDAILSDILRKAKVLAYQIESTNLKNWVNQELDGYKLRSDLPDYRILKTSCFGKWTNNYWMVPIKPVPISLIKDANIKVALTEFPIYDGIKSIEEHTQDRDKHYYLLPEVVSSVNYYVKENGYGYMNLEYAISTGAFEQILDTVKNRLQDFVLELGQNWNPKQTLPPQEILNNLVSVFIYNNVSQGDHMPTTFDQRGQRVDNQYNAVGDINIQVNNKDDLVIELENIRSKIEGAKNTQNLNRDLAIEAEYNILQASKEAQKENPNKNIFAEHVDKAKELLSDVAAVAGIVSALSKIIEVAQQVLK